MRYLRARLHQIALDEAHAKEAATRRAQLGTGERSEKIRTYNFPEGRVTDHRIKHTSHQLDDVLGGGATLDGFIDELLAAERSAQLADAATTRTDAAGRGRSPRRRLPQPARRGRRAGRRRVRGAPAARSWISIGRACSRA